MILISTAVAGANTTNSLNFGAIFAFIIAAVAFFIIARFIVKSGNSSDETRDENFYLREIRKYVRIIAFLLLGCAYFTIVWLVILAL